MPKRFYPTPLSSTKSTRSRAAWLVALSGVGIVVMVMLVLEATRQNSPSIVTSERTRIATTEEPRQQQVVIDTTSSAEFPTSRPADSVEAQAESLTIQPPGISVEAGNSTKASPTSSPLPTVTLFNGCGVKGIGGRAREALERMGFNVVDVRNARTYDYKSSEVLDRVESRSAGRVLADSLGIKHKAVVWDTTRSDAGADISLIIGRDYRKLRWKL